MSDLKTYLHQDGPGPQLPVSSYFSEELYQKEMELIFQHTPLYLGHRLAVPEVGNYYALPQENEGRALVHNKNGIELISNVCRHRQAIMLRGRGTTGENIVCPLHRWTYKTDGQLIGAPHFDQNPCMNLQRFPVSEWNGLLFENHGRNISRDFEKLGPRADLDFSGYVLDHVEQHVCNYNWKTFIEVYLEDYHVGPFHPGLGNFVTCDDLTWEYGEEYSVQRVGIANGLTKSGSAVYKKWQEVVRNYRRNAGLPEVPPHGAIWLLYYPTLMIEWYPHVLVVSNLYPMGTQKTLNTVEFYYPEEIAAFERDFIEAERAAYMETCIEDDEIGERMDIGRRALMERGVSEVGPYQNPMENGMEQFHLWYRKIMKEPAQQQTPRLAAE